MSFSITVKQKLFDLSTPRVMGILNATPDSFYTGSRARTEKEIARRLQLCAEISAKLDNQMQKVKEIIEDDSQYL